MIEHYHVSIDPRLQATDQIHDILTRTMLTLGKSGKMFFLVETPIPLWRIYLDGFNKEDQQFFNCSVCRRFIQRFGALVYVDTDGRLISPIWRALLDNPVYGKSAAALMAVVENTRIERAFYCEDRIPEKCNDAGGFPHLGLSLPYDILQSHGTKGGARKKDHRFNLVTRFLRGDRDCKPASMGALAQALQFFDSDKAVNAEGYKKMTAWLIRHHTHPRDGFVRHIAANTLRLAVCEVPEGWCHPRSGVFSEVYRMILDNCSYEDILRRYLEMTRGDNYMRAKKEAPRGQLMNAAKIFDKLGITQALYRRALKPEEVVAFWTPSQEEADQAQQAQSQSKNPFEEILRLREPKEEVAQLDIPPKEMSWKKFVREILPNAKRVFILTPMGESGYTMLTTQAREDAPPILKWDRPERRNPISSVSFTQGSPAYWWGLKAGEWVEVYAISKCHQSWTMEEGEYRDGRADWIFLKGAFVSDRMPVKSSMGACLFPNTLNPDLHEVRSAIEMYNNRHSKMEGIEGDAEVAVCLPVWSDPGLAVDWILRVDDGTIQSQYRISRWD